MFFLFCVNVAVTAWCKLSMNNVSCLHQALDPQALGTLATMLGDYMMLSKMVPGRQQPTVAITRGNAVSSKRCPSLLNGFSFHAEMQAHAKQLLFRAGQNFCSETSYQFCIFSSRRNKFTNLSKKLKFQYQKEMF